MSEIRSQLLVAQNNRSDYDTEFEIIRLGLVEYKGANDKLQVLGESEVDQSKLNETINAIKEVTRLNSTLKDSIIQLEKISRGVDQRNKTKRLRDMYSKEQDRHQQVLKGIMSECSDDLRDKLKENSNTKNNKQNGNINGNNNGNINGKHNEKKLEIYYEKYDEEGQVVMSGKKQDQVELQHIDWQNQLIRENQQDLDQVHSKAVLLNRIVEDLALEVDNQDVHMDLIQGQMNTTKDNIQGAQKELVKAQDTQKSSTKKYVCLLVCALMAIGLLIMILMLAI